MSDEIKFGVVMTMVISITFMWLIIFIYIIEDIKKDRELHRAQIDCVKNTQNIELCFFEKGK